MGIPGDLGALRVVRRAVGRRAGPRRRRAGRSGRCRALDRDVAVGAAGSRAARRRGASSGWSSRCSAASTPDGPTRCRSTATMPALAAALRRDGGSLVEAAAADDRADRSARPAGPVFVSLAGGLARLPDDAGAPRPLHRAHRRAPCARSAGVEPALRSTAVRCPNRASSTPTRSSSRPRRRRRPGCCAAIAPAAAAELAGIETASMAIVTLAFADVEPPPGSGLLVGSRRAVRGQGDHAVVAEVAGARRPG